jgi:hypothetical protein
MKRIESTRQAKDNFTADIGDRHFDKISADPAVEKHYTKVDVAISKINEAKF